MKKFFFIAGEKSGDNIGAKLIKELKKYYPESVFVGVGGNSMEKEGLKNLMDISQLSIIGYWQVIKNFFSFRKIFNQLRQILASEKPDVLITIDSPGLNYMMAQTIDNCLKIHYVAPTVWAYKPSRAAKYSKVFDGLICILPFEPEYFIKERLKSVYVGHPIIEDLTQKSQNKDYILATPGSRNQEINYLMPIFVEVLNLLKQKVKFMVPETKFKQVKSYLTNAQFDYEIVSDINKQETIKGSKLALSKSGTVTLDIALAGVPQIMCYKIDWFTAFLGRIFIKLKYLSLPNIILGEEVIPELIQENLSTQSLYNKIIEILDNPELMTNQVKKAKQLAKILGYGDDLTPSQKAAEFIVKCCENAKFNEG